MKPDPTDPDEDALVQLLRALPREDLDASRTESLRRRAHAELRRAVRPGPGKFFGALEPLLLAACGACMLTRLALVLALLWQAARTSQ